MSHQALNVSVPANDDAATDPLARLATVFETRACELPTSRLGGRITAISATHIQVAGLATTVRLGDAVETDTGIMGEVIALQDGIATVKLFASAPRLGLGTIAWVRDSLSLRPTRAWRGRVIDALGQPIDGRGDLPIGERQYDVEVDPLPAMELDRLSAPLKTGIRAVDIFTPLCVGQRVGVFAGSGVGKTTLLSMFAGATSFDTVVVALVGERAREVREFVEDALAEKAQHAVMVVSTSAEDAMRRKLSAQTAVAIAEYFRDCGDRVLLIVDSITRYAHALREIASAAGEAPMARGFPPSVFANVPRLLERAGPGRPDSGSITGLFSVLVDGDDINDPIADNIRGTLDGHIVLSRHVADQGRFPAIDLQSSISRTSHLSWTSEQGKLVSQLKAMVARFEETRDLRAAGAYQPGADAELDQAVHLAPRLYQALIQGPKETSIDDAFLAVAAALHTSEPEAE
ncbi:MAG: FliI/YscN family ATPase [Pseudomonadota bacterium]